jgi:hypothetical protein
MGRLGFVELLTSIVKAVGQFVVGQTPMLSAPLLSGTVIWQAVGKVISKETLLYIPG